MGQYYYPIILADNNENQKEIIRIFMKAWNYNNGAKLMEHSYILNDFVQAFESLLTEEDIFYKSRVVWAGDYADNEPNQDKNLYQLCKIYKEKLLKPQIKDTSIYKYIVNHTKKEYVNKENREIHPLPLLTAEGNGNGGGDYKGIDENLVGRWARDCISLEKEKPENYTELECDFQE